MSTQLYKERKPFLILQLRLEDIVADSEFEAILNYGGIEPSSAHRIRVEQSGIPPLDLDDYSAIIVGGSPFDITTPANEKSDVQNRLEAHFNDLLDVVVRRDFPFLGACSGCGLLGNYLGAPISGRYAEPIGWVEVTVTEAGRNEPLLSDFPPVFDVLCGHKEACDTVPAGSTLLLSGTACPIQMFRIGKNVFATQFHPEGDVAGFEIRIDAYKYHGYFAPDQADAIMSRVRTSDTPHGQELLRRFIERYRL